MTDTPTPTPPPDPDPAPDDPATNDNGGPSWADERRRQTYGDTPAPEPAPTRRTKR